MVVDVEAGRPGGGRRRGTGGRLGPALAAGLAAAVVAALVLSGRETGQDAPPAQAAPALAAALSGRLVATAGETHFPLCRGGRRVTCVVDGDTFWHRGEKIRIADINTPELSAPCAAERRLARQARDRLRTLLSAGPFELRAGLRDTDRYGRSLRVVTRAGRSLGETLVAEGLAERWTGRRGSWCG